MPQVAQHRDADLIYLSACNNPFMASMDGLDPQRIAFGLRITALREARELTQTELATRAGIKQSSLWEIENAVTKEVSARVLIGLCRALETTWEYLWEGSDSDPGDAEAEAELVAIYRGLAEGEAKRAFMQAARSAKVMHDAMNPGPASALDAHRIPRPEPRPKRIRKPRH